MSDKSKKEVKKSDTKKSDTKKSEPTDLSPDAPAFGWSRYAERINGRFAMIGFGALILLEIFTRQDIYTWLGLR